MKIQSIKVEERLSKNGKKYYVLEIVTQNGYTFTQMITSEQYYCFTH